MDSKDKIIVEIDQRIERLIPEYLENRKKDVYLLTAALEKPDFVEIRSIAHDLKGTGNGFGFKELTVIGTELEYAVFDRNKIKIKNLIERMKDYLERIDIHYLPPFHRSSS